MGNHRIDYKQFEQGRMISISDLIEEILKKIWLIIIFAIVFAAACGGYKYKQDKEAFDLLAMTADTEELQEELSNDELQEVRYVLLLKNDLEQQEQYVTDSVLMQINPYEENRITLQYVIKSSTGNENNIMKALTNYVNQGGLAAELSTDQSDIDCRYISELVFADNSVWNVSDKSAEAEGADSDIFSVTVVQLDQTACETLAAEVQACLEMYLTQRADVFGESQLVLVDDSFTEVIDDALRSYQYEKLAKISSLRDQIDLQTEELNDSQNQVLSSLASNEEKNEGLSNVQGTEVETESPSLSKKYVGIGAVLGIILSIIILVLYYLFRGTLNFAAEFQIAFDIPVWAQISMRKRKSVLVRLWRRIVRKKSLSPENEKQLVVSNIKSYCKGNKIKDILITGSGESLKNNPWISELKSALKMEGISVNTADDLPYSAETFEQLAEYGHVVLVETLHVSKYNDVVREIQKCIEQNVQIAGAVVID